MPNKPPRKIGSLLRTAEINGFKISETRAMLKARKDAQNVKSTSDPGTLTLRSHEDRLRDRLHPGPEVIADALPVGGLGSGVAEPGKGKTLVADEMAGCVATGAPFAGRATIKGRVLYICTDSPASTERRMLAHSPEAAANIFTICDGVVLPGSFALIRAAIKTVKPILVINDTHDSSREHSDGGYAGQDGMAESIMREWRSIAVDNQLAVFIVHHATRADGLRPRGSLVFDARMDWIAVIEQLASGSIQMRSIKCRDGETGPVGIWNIVPVTVGDKPVPTLVYAGDALPQVKRTPDMVVLHQLQLRHTSNPKPFTCQELCKAANIPSKGSLSKILGRLRDQGLVEPQGQPRLTEAGLSSTEASTGPHSEGVVDGLVDARTQAWTASELLS